MFAVVAVHTPMARRLEAPSNTGSEPTELGLTFHYRVPPEVAGQIQPGHLIWVPFGKQELHGIVLALTDQLPQGVETARPLRGLAMPAPVATIAQLELARWMSRQYLAPVLDCLLVMLPPGLVQRAEPVLALTSAARQALTAPPEPGDPARGSVGQSGAAPQQLAFGSADFQAIAAQQPFFPQFPDLRPEQHALLTLLADSEAVPERVLAKQSPDVLRRSMLQPLIERGLISRQRRIMEPPLRPKRERQVSLAANQETIERLLPTLGRSSKQADVLAWLDQRQEQPTTLAALCDAVGCSPAPVRSLAKRGWVEISPEQRWLSLNLPPGEVPEVIAGALARAPAQAKALMLVRERAEHADQVDEAALRSEHGVSPATLAALERRGLLKRQVEQPMVRLLLEPKAVRARLIELRGGEKYRPVLAALAAEPEPVWLGWLYAETETNLTTLRELAAAGLISLEEAEVWRDPLAGKEFVADQAPVLTTDQALVWREIERALVAGLPGSSSDAEPSAESQPSSSGPSPGAVFLLHGVTGSGKTEIYLRAIAATLEANRQALALVPEIALTPQTVRRFAARFGERVTIYHSGLSAGERYDVWRRVRAGQIDVVVGTRSALFLPMPRLGLLVLDEEHDPSYKEAQRSPRYHAREAALWLARQAGVTVILGSATPSLETSYAAQLGRLRLLELPRRIMGHARAIDQQQQRLHLRQTVYRPVDALAAEARFTELPNVRVVDLRQELRAGNRSIFSRALQQALDDVLKARQQAILFLNRRGRATFVICRDCGHVQTCEQCDVPLTYHEQAAPADRRAYLVCHHCGNRELSPERCPECGSRRIRYLGAGTEKIVELVHTLWPGATVVRWDRDVTGRKGSHDAILERFASGKADVMVGTQMIAKGLDLPLVTLVGVISADVGLYLPDFRAAERSFQLLTQVAGRAGRSLLGGQVILQTYRPEHYAIQAAKRHDYLDFYRQELGFRRQLGYPPFRRLARLLYVHRERRRAQQEAEALGRGLGFTIHEQGLADVDLIGPAPCFFGRERGKHRWQIIVRAIDPAGFLQTVEIPAGWRIDVDPISLL